MSIYLLDITLVVDHSDLNICVLLEVLLRLPEVAPAGVVYISVIAWPYPRRAGGRAASVRTEAGELGDRLDGFVDRIRQDYRAAWVRRAQGPLPLCAAGSVETKRCSNPGF